MTARTQRNVLNYAGFAALSVAVAVLTALMTQLPGDAPINWRVIVTAGVSSLLGVLTMALTSMKLTRVGSEEIAARVDTLREEGVRRRDMVVLPKADAVSLAAGVSPVDPSMTPDETDRLLTLIRTVGPDRSIDALTAILDDERPMQLKAEHDPLPPIPRYP